MNSSSSRSAGDVEKSVCPLCSPLLLWASLLPLRAAHSIGIFQIAKALSGSDMNPLIKRSRNIAKSVQSQYTYALSGTQLTKAYRVADYFHRAKFLRIELHMQKSNTPNFESLGTRWVSSLAICEKFTHENLVLPNLQRACPPKITHYTVFNRDEVFIVFLSITCVRLVCDNFKIDSSCVHGKMSTHQTLEENWKCAIFDV